jgi:hypothetical protein
MKLYWGSHTCAIGIQILLEEIGKPYETEKLDVAGGATHRLPFSAINPKCKVPTPGTRRRLGPDRVQRHCDMACPFKPGQEPPSD